MCPVALHNLLELEQEHMVLHEDLRNVAKEDLMKLLVINCLLGWLHHLLYDKFQVFAVCLLTR